MKRIALLMLFATMPILHAQNQPDPNEYVLKVFELKYVSPSQMARLIGYNTERKDDQLKVLVVNVPRKRMEEVEQFIKRFDVPPPPVQNVEVTIYIMSTLGQPSTATIPVELEGVVKQLRNMFSYKTYQLIDTQVIRVRPGQVGEASGVVNSGAAGSGFAGEPKTVSQIRFKAASVSDDEKGRAIRIDGLKVGLRIPIPSSYRAGVTGKGSLEGTGFQYLETGINTDVDVHEGQKVVVGKANMEGSDRASIVVLMAKVVE